MTAYERKKLIEDISDRVVEKLLSIGISDETLSAKEAAKYLNISLKTLYNKIDDIPHSKSGNKLIFSKRSLHDYLYR